MMRESDALMQTCALWMRGCAFVWLLMQALAGQTSSVPYATNSDGPGPTFRSEKVRVAYRGTYSSVRSVNFRELVERRERDDPDDHLESRLDAVHYLTGTAATKESWALVLYSWFDAGGSSSQGSVALVFRVAAGRLQAVQKIGWDTHFQAGEPTNSFDPVTNTLTIRSAHYIPGDAHCCVSAMDVVTYRWNGERFVQSGIETQLSAYGKGEGKTLPTAAQR